MPSPISGAGGGDASASNQSTQITAEQAILAKIIAAPATEAKQDSIITKLTAGAASIGKAEDVASADADVGVPAMAIRKATPANISGTDGDYEMLQVSAGRLWASATIDAALPAGTNVIGHAIIDSGSTTAVTQATGTNLHTVVDSGTITTVSTVTNLSQMGGVAIALNTGVRSTGTQRVTIATDDVVPSSQSGTWTVQPGNTANTTAWKVDGSAVTQPVSFSKAGPANIATGQVALSTSAATAVVARATRRGCTLKNLDASIKIYVGPATVTSSNGMELKAGESTVVNWVGLVQAIAASGTPTIAYLDEYD